MDRFLEGFNYYFDGILLIGRKFSTTYLRLDKDGESYVLNIFDSSCRDRNKIITTKKLPLEFMKDFTLFELHSNRIFIDNLKLNNYYNKFVWDKENHLQYDDYKLCVDFPNKIKESNLMLHIALHTDILIKT